jgi:AraC family transcriptional regulator, regulatory protein of adaptative response / DNA-3-methyladenine glycosylase II
MLLDADQCYRALTAHDARFDGRFFVGVATTRIYCRPVCSARTPRRGNCRFFPSAAAAEAEGFRPCLRCRPELAPGHAAVDANRRLAQAAAGLIDDGRLGADARLPDLAEEFGVSPVEYAQTQRLLLAKRLLTDTALPVIEVALASGFSSLRRFNHLFRSRYRMTPVALRHAAPAAARDELAFDLAYRPPYDWEAMHDFLARRAIAGVEAVEGRKYLRTVRIERGGKTIAGWIAVGPSKKPRALSVTASASLAPALPAVLGRAKHQFDLACHPDEIAAALGPLAEEHPGLRLPGAFDGFETAVRAILGQQVTVRAASLIAGRFAGAFGDAIETPHASLTHLFPSAARVAAVAPSDIAAMGIIAARARAISVLAGAMAAGRLRLDPTAEVDATLVELQAIPGIGPWTAQYIAMRALGWPDAFPHPDVAVLKAMKEKSPRVAATAADRWRPWRAYAVLHLWKSLEKKP